MDTVDIRDWQPGDLGRIVTLHGTYYAGQWGLLPAFEAEVAEEIGLFARSFRSGADGLWVATVDGETAGAVAIQALGEAAARLRWFIVDPARQGGGIGNRLMEHAMEFCRRAGHRRVVLHTFKGLDVAQALYRRHGFRLEKEEAGFPWGPALTLQTFGMEMSND